MPPIDLSHPGWWALLWSIASFCASAAVGIYVYMTSRDRVRISRIEGIEADLRERLSCAASEHGPMRTAIAILEEAQRHAPTRSELRTVETQAHQRMDTIAEALNELRGSAKRVEMTLDLISQHLMGVIDGRR